MKIRTPHDAGSFVRSVRQRLGETQEQFAGRFGRTQKWLSGVESGANANLSLSTFLEFLNAAGIGIEFVAPVLASASSPRAPAIDTGDLLDEFPDDPDEGGPRP